MGALTPINIGTVEGDGTGDGARTAGITINSNFAILEAGYVGQHLYTGTSETLELADTGKMVGMDNASPCSLNIPLNAVVDFPVNTRIDITQIGVGLLTVTITATGTLVGDPVSWGEGKALSLWQKAIDVWYIYGGNAA
jgi:hypothetical protein